MATIKRKTRRLLLYKFHLHRFKESGMTTAYSHTIGEASGVSASQVRKDFSSIKLKGRKRGGYDVKEILNTLNTIFGCEFKNIIIIGMGNIGRALARYSPQFYSKHLNIIAGFDVNPSKYRKSYGIPVFSIRLIPEIMQQQSVTTAIISVPPQMAQSICDVLISHGIKGILNFSPVKLRVPSSIIVNDINIANELENVASNLNAYET